MAYSKLVEKRIREFIRMYGEGIAIAINNTGLFFPAVIGQSAWESGYGERIPPNSNNFAGIKYNPNLQNVVGFVIADTTEYIRGRKVKRKEKFSKFKDVASGFKAHIEVLMKDRYKNARLNAKSPEEQMVMIAQSGYSTTPAQQYMEQMKPLIEAARDISGLGRISDMAEKPQQAPPTQPTQTKPKQTIIRGGSSFEPIRIYDKF
jgi:flagellum-specific peptidoglycan hydrolase FlgJ